MRKTPGLLALLALLAVFIAFPLVISNPAITAIAVFALIFAAAATGWNIFSGYTGYIALGHAAYFGVGAYALTLMSQYWNIPGGYIPFLLLPLAGVAAGIFAIPLGWIALRTRRHTFVVITVATFFILQLMAYNLKGLTNGSTGLSLPMPTWTGDFFNLPFYYVSLVMVLAALAVSWWVRNSKYGLGLLAIRDDEDRALGLGVKTEPFKLVAFVISAIFVGMAGAIYVYFIGSIYPPTAFDPLFDLAIALMGFMGGLGTLAGPILGALVLETMQQYFTLTFGASGYYLIIYGVLFLVIILLLPEGIVPTVRKHWLTWMASRGNRGSGGADSHVPATSTQAEEALAVESKEA